MPAPAPLLGAVQLPIIAAGGRTTCGIDGTGAALCLGSGSQGQLGNGGTTTSGGPSGVVGMNPATAISVGSEHTCAIRNRRVCCWGNGGSGRLGTGSAFSTSTPRHVVGVLGPRAIAAGGSHTCAIDEARRAWCWGDNSHGQLGVDSVTSSAIPVRVGSLHSVVAIAAGSPAQVMRSDMPTIEAAVTLHTLAAVYTTRFGAASDGLGATWTGALASPIDALCVGSCQGSNDVIDLFDVDDDMGAAYASTRHYPSGSASTFARPFWQLYPPLPAGKRIGNAHDQLHPGGYQFPHNKHGTNRFYRLVGAGKAATVTVSAPGGFGCTTNALDLIVYRRGVAIGFNGATTGSQAGCPSVSFFAEKGVAHVVWIRIAPTYQGSASSWDLDVSLRAHL